MAGPYTGMRYEQACESRHCHGYRLDLSERRGEHADDCTHSILDEA